MNLASTHAMQRVVCGAAALALALACGGGSGSGRAGDDGRLRVVATTSIVADLVHQIGAGDVALESLMGAGVDPHLYKPSAGDVRRMSSAQVVLYNGLHLEGKMGDLLGEVGQRGVRTRAVAECIDDKRLIPTNDAATLHDPHVWFDVGLWKQAAECVGETLAAADPAHADAYRQRTEAYVGQLADLDAWIHEEIASLPPERRVLVTAHDAFSYFGRAYGLEVRGLLGVSTAAEAGTADVQELARFIVEAEVPAVFVESSVSPRFVEALQEAVRALGYDVVIGGQLYSDALGSPGSPAASYVGTVRSNVDTIVAALGGAKPPAE